MNKSTGDPDPMTTAKTRRTPLFETHRRLDGKMVEYAGWSLPVQYAGLVEEHSAVRTHAGLFDVSHMGEIAVTGADAGKFLDRIVTNDLSAMVDGQAVYSPMCAEDGGTLDDLLVYRRSCDSYLLVVNAANRKADFAWISDAATGHGPSSASGFRVNVEDVSDRFGLLALQGPAAADVLAQASADDLRKMPYYRFAENVDIAGCRCLVSRTGYTGEDGFEILVPAAETVTVWDAVMAVELPSPPEAGDAVLRVVPCGLGCRDTLRFEAGMPLYGNELGRDITPLEAGLDRFVRLEKPAFVGRESLAALKAAGLPRKVTGFEMTGRGVARHGYPVWTSDASRVIGVVTTGYHSPTLGRAVGVALVETASAGDPELQIEIRGKLVPARTRSRFFYKRKARTTP